MFAVTAARSDTSDPLAALELGQHADPVPPDGWATVTVKAAALNHHDLWSLRGVGLPADRLPMILGCDAAGVDEDGNDVVVHAVIGDPSGGDETLDPGRSLLSEKYDGTMAERVTVPRRNLVPKPAALSFEQAACLPTAYLTAYRMLFTRSGLAPGATILVQGAGGGVATALILLGPARSSSAPTGPSSPGRACRSGSTRSWRRSGRRPGRTRCAPCGRAAPSWSAGRPAGRSRPPT
jgi:NADPH:quinone reductase-like Zn-dependent oxidoreductase